MGLFRRKPTKYKEEDSSSTTTASASTTAVASTASSSNTTLASTTSSTAPSKTLRKFKSTIFPVYLSNSNNSSNSSYVVETIPSCVECTLYPARKGSIFCRMTCLTNARMRAPCLINLTSSHPIFQSVSALFSKSWNHATPVPDVERVYAIVSPEAQTRPYRLYRDQIEAKHKFGDKDSPTGNEQPRWHGTLCNCSLTAPDSTGTLCDSPACPLCNIIRVSYDIAYSGFKWMRYGKGIYSTCTSSKANDYSKNATESPLKAVLLNDVVIGKGIIMSSDNPGLTAPPPGYDSVLAVPRKRLKRGGAPSGLNYDETIVYRNDAIKPVYLVVYQATPSIPTSTPTNSPATSTPSPRQKLASAFFKPVQMVPTTKSTTFMSSPPSSSVGSEESPLQEENNMVSPGSSSSVSFSDTSQSFPPPSSLPYSVSSPSTPYYAYNPPPPMYHPPTPMYSGATSQRLSLPPNRVSLFIWLFWLVPLLVSLL